MSIQEIIDSIKECIKNSIDIPEDKFDNFIDIFNKVLILENENDNLTKLLNLMPFYPVKDISDLSRDKIKTLSKEIKINKKIGGGSYAVIYDGKMTETDEDIVVRSNVSHQIIMKRRVPERDLRVIFSSVLRTSMKENLITIILYCYCEKFPLIFTLGNPFLSIKGIYKIYKGRKDKQDQQQLDENTHPMNLSVICVMEKANYEMRRIHSNSDLFGVLAWISFNLDKLHDVMDFAHRDFHNKNVMLNKIPSQTINVGFPIKNQTFRPYIIDFGEVCVNLRCDNCKDLQDPQIYEDRDKVCTNRSHDLRYFMSGLNSNNGDIFSEYIAYKFGILDKTYEFRDYYEKLIHHVDEAFLPKTILNEISSFFDLSGDYKEQPLDLTKIKQGAGPII